MPISRLLYFPFVIGALVFLYLTWEVDEGYSLYIVPMVIMIALIYVLSPQIDWWWYRRRPPQLEEPVRRLFFRHMVFYQNLSVEGRKRFSERVALFRIAHDYMPQAMESVPEDVKAIIAAAAVQLTFGREDYLLEPFEHIIVYPKPFPSPQFPRNVHASEIYEEDGVVMFSMEQLMYAFANPRQYYQLGLHEFAKVLIHKYREEDWPAMEADIWEKLEAISGMPRPAIVKWINVPEAAVPALAVCISHFFIFPEQFRIILPDLYQQLAMRLNLDPLQPG